MSEERGIQLLQRLFDAYGRERFNDQYGEDLQGERYQDLVEEATDFFAVAPEQIESFTETFCDFSVVDYGELLTYARARFAQQGLTPQEVVQEPVSRESH